MFLELDEKIARENTIYELLQQKKKLKAGLELFVKFYQRLCDTILDGKIKNERELIEANFDETATYQFKDNNGWSSSSIDKDTMEELKTLCDTQSDTKVSFSIHVYDYECYYDSTDNRFYQKNLSTNNTREFRLIDTKGSASLTNAHIQELLNCRIQMSDMFPNEEEKELILHAVSNEKKDIFSEALASLGTFYSKYSLRKQYDPQRSELWIRPKLFIRWLEKCIHEKVEEFIVGFHGSKHFDAIKIHPDILTLQKMDQNGTAMGPGFYFSRGTDTVPDDYSRECSQYCSYKDGSVIMCLIAIPKKSTTQIVSYGLRTVYNKPGPLDNSNDNVCVVREHGLYLPLGICAM